MNVTITPTLLKGTITPPPSKSQAHRLLIAAALSGGVSTISNLADSQDILATRRCLSALGAGLEELGPGVVRVHGLGNGIVMAPPFAPLDCGESGSTLRFLIPVALLAGSVADEPLLRQAGFRYLCPINPPGFSLEQAMRPDVAKARLGQAAARVVQQYLADRPSAER